MLFCNPQNPCSFHNIKKYCKRCFLEEKKEHRNAFHVKIDLNTNSQSGIPFKIIIVNLNSIHFSMIWYTSKTVSLVFIFSRRS